MRRSLSQVSLEVSLQSRQTLFYDLYTSASWELTLQALVTRSGKVVEFFFFRENVKSVVLLMQY